MPRPRRSRILLVGLPMFAVFAAFGAIVWLAYDHGADNPPVGEPPLIKAPAMALKLPPDEAGAPAVADQGEVRDLLTDTPGDQMEQLLPSPEPPMAPQVAETPPPDTDVGDAATPPPPAPGDTAAVDQAPPPQVAPPAPVAPPPPQVAAPPPQVAATTAEPPRPAPLAVERPSAAQTGAKPPATAPQPSPKEAEAALDALLAEVTKPTTSPPPAPAPTVVQPPPAPVQPRPPVATAPAPPATTTAAANPAATPRPAPPAIASPFGRPNGGEVTPIAPDRPSARPPAGAAAPTIAPAPNGSVAALEGAYRIQLAAVRDEADARRAWDLFLVDLGSVLQGVQPFIERAETANGVFYRVQIGPFANLQDAESLCDELKRRNASCFVIRR